MQTLFEVLYLHFPICCFNRLMMQAALSPLYRWVNWGFDKLIIQGSLAHTWWSWDSVLSMWTSIPNYTINSVLIIPFTRPRLQVTALLQKVVYVFIRKSVCFFFLILCLALRTKIAGQPYFMLLYLLLLRPQQFKAT